MTTTSARDDAHWHIEHTTEAQAPPEAIWALFRDVAGWKTWNKGVASSQLDGPFATGTWFTMTPTGGEPLRSQLRDVRENESFVDETRVGELVVMVHHRLTALSDGHTRISYALSAEGPGAAEIGPMVAADFPDVLASLKVRVSEVRP
jgi:Polyketide cyclase / dehydrase and lipid transport